MPKNTSHGLLRPKITENIKTVVADIDNDLATIQSVLATDPRQHAERFSLVETDTPLLDEHATHRAADASRRANAAPTSAASSAGNTTVRHSGLRGMRGK